MKEKLEDLFFFIQYFDINYKSQSLSELQILLFCFWIWVWRISAGIYVRFDESDVGRLERW